MVSAVLHVSEVDPEACLRSLPSELQSSLSLRTLLPETAKRAPAMNAAMRSEGVGCNAARKGCGSGGDTGGGRPGGSSRLGGGPLAAAATAASNMDGSTDCEGRPGGGAIETKARRC